MSKKRQQYGSEFKAKVALAAVRGDETVAQLASRYGLHPTQVNAWKRQLTTQASELFARGPGGQSGTGQQVEELYRVIGQLTVEKDFLASRLGH